MSKSPGQRSIFPAPKDMIVSALQADSLARVVPDPARPKGQEMCLISDPKNAVPRAEDGLDLEIRVTVRNDIFPWEKDEPETPRQALEAYIKLLRDCTPEQIKMYVCGVLHEHQFEEVVAAAAEEVST